MRVYLAAQVISHSVAAGITLLSKLKHMPDESQDTAEFLEKFDCI